MSQVKADAASMLLDRFDTARVLGNVSVSTVVRLERAGILKPVRLNKKAAPNSKTFYRKANVAAVARGGHGNG